MGLQLNEAVKERLSQLLTQRNMTQYQLFKKTGVPKSTINNIANCNYLSMHLRVIHELCQGLDVSLSEFFASPLFEESNLEP